MTKKAMWAEVLIFLTFIFGFFIANLVVPDREMSEQENKSLQQLPRFSFEALFDKTFTKEFETYTTDQFVLRDEWITLKAASELALGKEENNDVSYGKDQTLIEAFEEPDRSSSDKNVGYLNQLVANTDADVYFALIPGKSEIWADRLPARTPSDSQADYIEYCYGLSEANNVDILGAMREHADEYIYYRTDHHWTSLGAYYGYSAIGKAMDIAVPSARELHRPPRGLRQLLRHDLVQERLLLGEAGQHGDFRRRARGAQDYELPRGLPRRGAALR